MNREANIINSPMLNFDCLPTSASEVTTCFRCTLAFIRQLKLSDSTICEHNNFLHIHMTLLSITAETVTPAPHWLLCYQVFVVVPSHIRDSKEQLFSVLLPPIASHLSVFVVFKAGTSICIYIFADTDSIILGLCWKMSEDHVAGMKTDGSFYRTVITNHPLQCRFWRHKENMDQKCTFPESACLAKLLFYK